MLQKQSPDSYLSAFDYTVEPYLGCNFGCRYCFVPERGQIETGQPVDRWGLWRRQAAVADIEAELQQHADVLSGARLCLGGATDAWQPAEGKYRLTRRVLEILSTSRVGFLLASTRSPIILRDIDLLSRFGSRLRVAVSVGSDLESVRRAVEPQAPPFAHRLDTIRTLHDAGIDVRISVAPVLAYSGQFFDALMQLGVVLWLDLPDRRTPAAAQAHMATGSEVLQLAAQLRARYGPDRITFGSAQFPGHRPEGGPA